MRAVPPLLMFVLAPALAASLSAQSSAPTAVERRQHEQLVRRYVDAEATLLKALRAVVGHEVSLPQQAEIERLASARDTAHRRAKESELVTGLPVPDRKEALAGADHGDPADRVFARAQDLILAARRADVRRLVVRIGLPEDV
jgi:hypothetical protein